MWILGAGSLFVEGVATAGELSLKCISLQIISIATDTDIGGFHILGILVMAKSSKGFSSSYFARKLSPGPNLSSQTDQ